MTKGSARLSIKKKQRDVVNRENTHTDLQIPANYRKKFALLGLSIQSITQLSSMVLKVGGGALMGRLEKGECSSFMN